MSPLVPHPVSAAARDRAHGREEDRLCAAALRSFGHHTVRRLESVETDVAIARGRAVSPTKTRPIARIDRPATLLDTGMKPAIPSARALLFGAGLRCLPAVASAIERRVTMGDKSPKSKQRNQKQKDAEKNQNAAKAKAKQVGPAQQAPAKGKK
jgi:hypothetical protein